MPVPDDYSFQRYLAAKVSVDDRALNRPVWEALTHALLPASPAAPLKALEIGAGTGSMLERMLEWGLLAEAHYTAIDLLPENIVAARDRLRAWGKRHSFRVSETTGGLLLKKDGRRVQIELQACDLYDFIRYERGRRYWDLLVAHAFLDLVDIPSTLPQLFALLVENSLFYFTINFDGLTAFEPVIDSDLDELILRLYHSTMDERLAGGLPSGDSRAGRHLFSNLARSGATILSAGASDWVVFPGALGYPADEAYFLHFILHTLQSALEGNPALEPAKLAAWVAERHAQVERGELVYIAHQIDFLGKSPS